MPYTQPSRVLGDVARSWAGNDDAQVSCCLVLEQLRDAHGHARLRRLGDVEHGQPSRTVYRPAMIDVHCHILPGLDDGARTIEDAREIARAAAGEGITAIAATPHVRDDYPTRPGTMERGVTELRRDFHRHEIPVEVLTGGEVSIAAVWELTADELARFSLGGSGRYLLLECPYTGWPRTLDLAVSAVLGHGMTPVLGHPERNPQVQDRPDLLLDLVERGAIVQVTAASVDGRLGPAPKLAAERLVSLGIVHVIASDAHGPHIRDAGLRAAADALGNNELAVFATSIAPKAIADGEPLPTATALSGTDDS
jgi:protein-tyrosine phosphatase